MTTDQSTDYPPPSVQLMKIFARMSHEKRLLLLNAAEVISRGSIAFDDTVPQGAMETTLTRFDPNA